MQKPVSIHESWISVIGKEFECAYFKKLTTTIKKEVQEGITIYPNGEHIFSAFNLTPFEKVKVVILGQDPYHGVGQAHGLSFSVPKGVDIPPSLLNIFHEVQSDLGSSKPITSGNLEQWSAQGVLLLNTILTVRARQPLSHSSLGWEQFTDAVIAAISDLSVHVVFLLWGKSAQQKALLVDTSKHLILKAPHPSPLSAHRGFLGCGHFSKANQYLTEHGVKPIAWIS